MHDLTCPEVADSAPGFALDILDPTTRSQVAAHLVRCDGCREAVTSMQCSAAELLDLGSPGGYLVEPAWADDRPPARGARRRFRMVVTMATAALLVVGTTLGPEIEQATSHPERPSATIPLTAAGVTVGTVRIYTGRVVAIDVSVRGLRESGTMEVVVVDGSGIATAVGHIDVEGSRGEWLGLPGPDPRQLRTIMIVDSQRRQVASAPLAS